MQKFREEIVEKIKEKGIVWIREQLFHCRNSSGSLLFLAALKQAENELGYETSIMPEQLELNFDNSL